MIGIDRNAYPARGAERIEAAAARVGDADPLARFVAAQDPVWSAVTAELAAGAKRSHWMWFVFPQLAGLGSSPRARHYAITGLGEAGAYAVHPVLGGRLRQATELMLRHSHLPAEAILGPVDALKFASSMTLFRRAAPWQPVFAAALAAFCDGAEDGRTVRILDGAPLPDDAR